MSTDLHVRFALQRPGFRLDVDFALPGRGVTALFGTSGSGKTTCLRAIAGLERHPGGYCALAGEVWQDEAHFVPPHRRHIGYVFQDAQLFPHLSVADNLAYGQRRNAGADPRAVRAMAERMGVEGLLARRPERLSGGERQRVAIGRALLTQPRLLLLDEPLSALDHARKQEILPYLESLHRELDIPVVYVSHSPDEVARLADHLVLLDGGRCVAQGPLNAVLSRLDLPAVFSDDAGVVLEARVESHAPDDLTCLAFQGGQILVAARPEAVGTSLRCRVHARDVSLALSAPTDTSILNSVPCIVTALAPVETPGQWLVALDAGGTPLLSRITSRSVQRLALRPGLAVCALIKSVALLA